MASSSSSTLPEDTGAGEYIFLLNLIAEGSRPHLLHENRYVVLTAAQIAKLAEQIAVDIQTEAPRIHSVARSLKETVLPHLQLAKANLDMIMKTIPRDPEADAVSGLLTIVSRGMAQLQLEPTSYVDTMRQALSTVPPPQEAFLRFKKAITDLFNHLIEVLMQYYEIASSSVFSAEKKLALLRGQIYPVTRIGIFQSFLQQLMEVECTSNSIIRVLSLLDTVIGTCFSCMSEKPPTRTERKDKVCNHWQNFGTCAFGAKCHFLHPPRPKKSDHTADTRYDPVASVRPRLLLRRSNSPIPNGEHSPSTSPSTSAAAAAAAASVATTAVSISTGRVSPPEGAPSLAAAGSSDNKHILSLTSSTGSLAPPSKIRDGISYADAAKRPLDA